MKDLVSQLKRQYEPLASGFHTKTVSSLKEFDEVEEELEHDGFFKWMVRKINLIRVNKSLTLKRLGGGQFDPPIPVVFQKMYRLKKG